MPKLGRQRDWHCSTFNGALCSTQETKGPFQTMATGPKGASSTEQKGESGKDQTGGPSAELRELRRRKTYVDLRIPKVREELQALVAKRKRNAEAAQKAPKIEGAELKTEAAHRIYEHHESIRLKNELQSLDAESKSLVSQLREVRK
jgi:hypothetical protein